MGFYLDKNVDPTTRDYKGRCLLHCLACKTPDEDNMGKAKLLLGKNPYLVNCCDNSGKTPLGVAKIKLGELREKKKERIWCEYETKRLKGLIKLFEKYDGKTSDELKKKKSIELRK
jgi:hypothetical protein